LKKSKTDLKIGHKKLFTYVTTAAIARNQGIEEIHIRARGKFISKACDVAEILKRSIGLNYRDIKLNSTVLEVGNKRKYVTEIVIVMI